MSRAIEILPVCEGSTRFIIADLTTRIVAWKEALTTIPATSWIYTTYQIYIDAAQKQLIRSYEILAEQTAK